jgi:hypothetical protein
MGPGPSNPGHKKQMYIMKNEEMNVEIKNPVVRRHFEVAGKVMEVEDYLLGLDLTDKELVDMLKQVVKNVSEKRPGGRKYDKEKSIMNRLVDDLVYDDNNIFDLNIYSWDLLRDYVFWGIENEDKKVHSAILEIEEREGINVFRVIYDLLTERTTNPMYIEINKVEYELGGDFLTYMGLDGSIDDENEYNDDYEEYDKEDYVVEFIREFVSWNRDRKIEGVIG